jgi:hypothetical protein
MEANKKFWNQQQKALRQAFDRPEQRQTAVDLFLSQHAMVHSNEVSHLNCWSFEDEVWEGVDEAEARLIPPKEEHSLVWLLWHIARIEDVTMNLLLGSREQVYTQNDWMLRLKAPFDNTGNNSGPEEVRALSEAVDVGVLREYRFAVGRRTREIVRRVSAEQLAQRTPPDRLQRVKDEGAVKADAQEVFDYWGSLTGAGLLLMPPTRHCFIHLNEMLNVKKKVMRAWKQ